MSDSRSGLNPRTVIGVQYFAYFGVLGVFLPYFNLYCYHLGFSGFQIGLLSGLRSLTLTIFPIVWGVLADRYRARRRMYIACTVVSTLVWVLYLRATAFPAMFFITLLYGIFYAPIISFLETFTVETLGRDRKAYGRVRAWGSISFIVTVVTMGRVIDARSVDVILTTILIGSALLSMCAFGIPHIRSSAKGPAGVRLPELLNRRTLVFLFCAFLMLVSHGAYYGFFSIHLEALGYDNSFVGVAWALASLAEILVMVRSRSIFNRFSYKTVLTFSFGAAALRWFVLYATVSPAGILITQLLHAVTYGAFHMASILYMDQLTPEGSKTLGQALNNAVTYGLGLMTGFFINGWLFEAMGSGALFAVSGVTALAAGVVFMASGAASHDDSA